MNAVFVVQDSDLTSYYAIFDGHGGTDAAAYSVSHLHCEIASNKFYPDKPAEALREAFMHTDEKFIEKSKKQVSDLFLPFPDDDQSAFEISYIELLFQNRFYNIEAGIRNDCAMCTISVNRTKVDCWLGR